MQADTIEQVIQFLEEIIADAKAKQSRLGYFAALYKAVTVKVKQEIDKGPGKSVFQDVDRMEKLDVIFANRYLKSYTEYRDNGDTAEKCWQVAFQGTTYYPPIVLQHLFAGMNAHILLDLGIAAAQVMRDLGQPLEDLKHDFNEINNILGALLDKVEQELNGIWPYFRAFLKFIPFDFEDSIANFGMKEARNSAWRLAEQVYLLEGESLQEKIRERDERVAKSGYLILHPPSFLQFLLFLVKLTEVGSISTQIQWLNGEKGMKLV